MSTTVLVVDDEASITATIAAGLKKLGVKVLTAQDGIAAKEILEGPIRIDLVISDLAMPRMDGRALINHIRNERHEATPVIFITGSIDFSPDELMSLGAEAIISKPFSVMGLCTKAVVVANSTPA